MVISVPAAVGREGRFDVIVRRRIRHMHALDMDEPAERHQFDKFAGHIKSGAFAVRPLVADLAARPRLVDADRHRPAVGTEQPLLDQRRLGVCAVHRFRRSREAPVTTTWRSPSVFSVILLMADCLSLLRVSWRPERRRAGRNLRTRALRSIARAIGRSLSTAAAGASRHGRFVPSMRREDEARAFEHLEMPGDGRLRHLERLRQFHDGGFAQRQTCEDRPACWVSKRGKGGIEASDIASISNRLYN